METPNKEARLEQPENVRNNPNAYMPKEIIINTPILKLKWLTDYLKNIVHCSVELIDDAEYNDYVERCKVEVAKEISEA